MWQVAAVSLLLASAHMLANDRDALQTRGFFQVVARDGRVPIHHFPTVAFAPVVSAAHPCPWPFRVLASDRPRATRRRCGQWWVSTPSVACLCRYYLSEATSIMKKLIQACITSTCQLRADLFGRYTSATLKNFAAPLGIILNSLLQV